jgi:polysaccharide biosynthesis transport protein
MIKNYWLKVTGCVLGGLLVGYLIALFTPQAYDGEIQIMVDQRPMVNAKAMSNAEESVTDLVESSRPRTIATQVEQLTSIGVLGRASVAVARDIGLNVSAPQQVPEEHPLYIRNLIRSVRIGASNESDIIRLSVRMPSVELAERVAAQIYLSFDELNQDKSREAAGRAIASLERQQQGVQEQLVEIDQKLARLRTENNVASFSDQITNETAGVRNYADLRDQAQVDAISAEVRLTALQRELSQVPQWINSAEGTGINSNYQRIEAMLADARAERARLLADYLEDHHRIRALDEQIQRYEREFGELKNEIKSGSSRTVNPLWQSLTAEVAQMRAAVLALRSRAQSIDSYSQARQASLERFPQVQLEFETMLRKQNSLTLLNQAYSDRLESLRLSQRGRMNTSTLISPAIAFPDPVAPNYPMNLGIGALVGLFFGVFLAFRTESKRSPIRTLGQMNRLALQPSFRMIPELPIARVHLDRQPADVYLSLLGNFIRSSKRPYRLGVVGVDRDAGATLTALNVALTAEMEGFATLLVDTSKNGDVGRQLGQQSEKVTSSLKENLTLFRARSGDTETSKVNGALEELGQLEQNCAITVMDLQPLKDGGQTALFAGTLDECVLLVRADHTKSVDFLQAQQMLADVGCSVITVVLSRARSTEDDLNILQDEPQVRALSGSKR